MPKFNPNSRQTFLYTPLDLLTVDIRSAASLILFCVSIDIFLDLEFDIGSASTITGTASVITGTMFVTTDTDGTTVGNVGRCGAAGGCGVIDVCGFCCSRGVDGACVVLVGTYVCSGVAGGSGAVLA